MHIHVLVQSPVYFGTVSVLFDNMLVINSSVCPDGDEVSVNLRHYITRNIFMQVTKEIFFFNL